MITITKPLILILFFAFTTWPHSIAQYRALEISTCASSYLDDNKDAAFEFKLGEPSQLRQYNLGFSLPLSLHIFITPNIGFACAREHYFNKNDFMTLLNSEFALKTNKMLLYGNLGIASTFWFQPDFKGAFISGEMNSAFNISANSVSRVATYGDAFNDNLT